MSNGAPITTILSAVANGDAAARAALWQCVYGELRQLAAGASRRERAPDAMQPTTLVHEAFLKLMGDQPAALANRRHFFAAAANAMRQILVDDARNRGRRKRGGGRRRIGFEGVGPGLADRPAGADGLDVLALHEALAKLEAMDARKAEVISLRFFGGLSGDETAELLGLSPRTIDSEWRFARAWLHKELGGAP